MIGLAQVILKEAWLKVEQGFRAGRELILARPEITIGRAEICDVGLFGDAAVDLLHAIIQRQKNAHVIHDAGSTTGTFVNEERIEVPKVLHSGDVIRIGRSVLRFGERARKG
jgi:pSer/pThr/pTyr-binding forkhead associated (FHA) protein